MGTLFVDKLDPQSGTSLELGSSGDTVSVNTGATTNLAGNVTLGASGKTITVPAGATITNNGTQTGFGGDMTPFFNAYVSSGYTVSNQAYVKVQFNTETADSNNTYDTSNYRFTPGVAGKYKLTSTFSNDQSNNDAINNVVMEIYKNGSSLGASAKSVVDYRNSEVTGAFVTVETIVDSDTDDYFEVFAYVSADSGTIFHDDGCSFTGFKIIE